MPTLNWIGRKAVENHHRQVPFHLLKEIPDLSVGEAGTGNLVVEGDNLLALKALLPYYGGQVKCIYIDPPYNTGNENWIYNDNVNSPEMRDWLGRTVGKEAEDLTRHDKWLCMMYPRLWLLRDMLTEDGAVFISIDDNEVQSLRFLMDEVFGRENFITTIVWQKIYTVKNSAKHMSEMHDYLVIYARKKTAWKRNLRPRDDESDEDYTNPDGDPEGPWISHALQSRNSYSKGKYAIKCPGGRIIAGPPPGTYWRVAEPKLWKLHAQGMVWWGEDENNSPRIKEHLKNAKDGVVPTTWWPYQYAGTNSDAKVHLRQMIGDKEMFITPKPVSLVRRILELASSGDSIVLDAFAGSGVTGHAVLEQNKRDGGSRRFVLVEMDHKVAVDVTQQRLTRAVKGYQYVTNKGKSVDVEGLGEGFRFATLGEALFDERGNIQSTVRFADLARHVYFVETGEPLPRERVSNTPLIGACRGTAIYLLYNGILKDRTPDGGNVLTTAVLHALPKHPGPKVVYGTACRLGTERLRREGLVFKQLPYKLRVSAP